MIGRLGELFQAWGRFVFRRRWLVLAGSAAAVLVLAGSAADLRVDNSTESFLVHDDPALRAYESFQREFGQDELILIGVRTRDVFALEFLEQLRALHEDVEARVPHVARVRSLINARDTRVVGDTLHVGELLEEWPDTPAELERVRDRAYANELMVDLFFNEAGTLAVLLVEPSLYAAARSSGEQEGSIGTLRPLRDEEVAELRASLDAVVAEHGAEDFQVLVTGKIPLESYINDLVSQEALQALAGALLLGMVVLAVLFRRASALILPVALVFGAVAATLGLMGLIGIPFSVTTSILPRLLTVVAFCNAIHILTPFYRQLETSSDRSSAIAAALGDSGLAVVLASLTTAGGVVAFTATGLAQTSNLGVAGSLGVVITVVLSVTALPALLSVVPLRARAATHSAVGRGAIEILASAGRRAVSSPVPVLGAGGALLLVALAGVAQLRFEQDALQWLPSGDPVRRATETLDADLGGILTLEVILRAENEDGFQDPILLRRLDAAAARAEDADREGLTMGKAISIADFVKEVHQALNEDDPRYRSIPSDREAVAQELLLFELGAREDLEDFVDGAYTTTRVSIRQPYADARRYSTFVREIRREITGIMGEEVSVEVSGITNLFGRIYAVLGRSMASSTILAFAFVAPLIVLLLGSLRLGLLAMIPNVSPLVLVFGLMGWLSIPLDNTTLLLGCIILGLAVDDTIHFMHGLRRELAAGSGLLAAVEATFRSVGVALLCTTLVLGSGFLVGTFSYMTNVAHFAGLASFATVSAFLSDVFLAPALIALFGPAQVR